MAPEVKVAVALVSLQDHSARPVPAAVVRPECNTFFVVPILRVPSP